MRKLQTQGVHHITIVGADRQTSIDFWEGVLGMPFVFEQPNLDNESESHLYFDPGDGRLITVFTNEERKPDPTRTPTDIGCVHHIAFSVSQATFHQAVERLDERGIQHSGVKDRGFMDSIYFKDPLGLLIELASYRFEPPFGFTHARRAARGAQAPRGAGRLPHRPGAPRRRHRGARHAFTRVPLGRPLAEGSLPLTEDHMAANTLNILKPSVNNLTVRIFVRAAGLDFEEVDVWGTTTAPGVPREVPGAPDADARGGGPAQRRAGGELRDHGRTCPTSTGSTQFYPTDPGKRAMVDNAMFYLIGTLYPLVARATYPTLGFAAIPRRGRHVRGRRRHEDEGAAGRRGGAGRAARGLPHVLHRGRPFIGGDHPSIADIRLAATLEFLRGHRLRLPAWARST